MKFAERGTFHGIECSDICNLLWEKGFFHSLMTEWA